MLHEAVWFRKGRLNFGNESFRVRGRREGGSSELHMHDWIIYYSFPLFYGTLKSLFSFLSARSLGTSVILSVSLLSRSQEAETLHCLFFFFIWAWLKQGNSTLRTLKILPNQNMHSTCCVVLVPLTNFPESPALSSWCCCVCVAVNRDTFVSFLH